MADGENNSAVAEAHQLSSMARLPPACNCDDLKALTTAFDILDETLFVGQGWRPSEAIEYLPAKITRTLIYCFIDDTYDALPGNFEPSCEIVSLIDRHGIIFRFDAERRTWAYGDLVGCGLVSGLSQFLQLPEPEIARRVFALIGEALVNALADYRNDVTS